MKRVYFFSTPADAAPLLSAFETGAPVKYVKYGQSATPNPPIHLNSSQIPSLGLATETTGSSSISYLVSSQESIQNMERFVDSAGQTRWLIDNGNNDGSVILTLAGLWGRDILLPGNMSTLHETKPAQQLMRRFLSALKKSGFVKIDMWWVGPDALEMLRGGKRLATAAVESPPDYDLPLPDELRNR
jgi:hypothetical protein